MIRDYMGVFCKVITVFVMPFLVWGGLIWGGLTVFEMTPHIYAVTGDVAGERVDVVGADSNAEETIEQMESAGSIVTVSYTHLDVYKRQHISLLSKSGGRRPGKTGHN